MAFANVPPNALGDNARPRPDVLAQDFMFDASLSLASRERHAPSPRDYRLKVDDLQITPSRGEKLGRQTPVAPLRLVLATEKTGIDEQLALEFPVNGTVFKQPNVPGGVFVPGDLALPISIQELGAWGELRDFTVFNLGNRSQEILQVTALGETG